MKTVHQDSESISYLGPKIWEIVSAKKKRFPSTVSKQKSVSGYHKVVFVEFTNNILVILVILQ